MGVLIIMLALLAGHLMGYPDEVVMAGTAGVAVARFLWDTVREFLEAVL